jgi:putative Ca2+/H+ antiporter (TMEM165/GDT1 family)
LNTHVGTRTGILARVGLTDCEFCSAEARLLLPGGFLATIAGLNIAHQGQDMDYKLLATVFATVFIAELGDKTQLATLLFAADREVSKWAVFAGASLALVATSALGVLAGSAISAVIGPKQLQLLAGLGFVGIGAWTLVGAIR